MLDEGEPPEFPAELEGGEDGVLAGEGDERGTGQRPVRVDAGPGVPQAVLAPGHQALLTAAPERDCDKMRCTLYRVTRQVDSNLLLTP